MSCPCRDLSAKIIKLMEETRPTKRQVVCTLAHVIACCSEDSVDVDEIAEHAHATLAYNFLMGERTKRTTGDA